VFKEFSISIVLIHLFACPCGSIIKADLLAFLKKNNYKFIALKSLVLVA